MATNPANAYMRWSKREVRDLRKLAGEGKPPHAIAARLGRTIASVQAKTTAEGVSLKTRKSM